MLPLRLGTTGSTLSILAVGAHPDDIEIGAGGTLLTLASSYERLIVRYVVLTGTDERHLEARHASTAFLPGAEVTVDLRSLSDGRLPAAWGQVKESLEEVAATYVPDVVIGPSWEDAHQDHRTIGEMLPTVFRSALYLAYEIPKWDGDMRRPTTYVPLTRDVARQKVALLSQCFPSQQKHDWWDDEVFLGIARLRGMECRAPYAEAFTCTKSVILPPCHHHRTTAGADLGVAAEGAGAAR